MEIAKALEAIEYKIATESDNFESGRTIKMDITDAWPPATKLADALNRKYPFVSVSYDHQSNGMIQLLLVNNNAGRK